MQDNWQWCNRCMGLCFFGYGAAGPCPAGGDHRHEGSGNYQLAGVGEGVSGEPGWHYCEGCQGLHFVGHDRIIGPCIASGRHQLVDTGTYVLRTGGDGQEDWRRCSRCRLLFFIGDGVNGSCPAGGPHTVDATSAFVLTILNEPAAPPPIDEPLEVRRTGDRSFLLLWTVADGVPEIVDGYEIWEASGSVPVRRIERVGTDRASFPASFPDDIFGDDEHDFAVCTFNRFGRSSFVTRRGPSFDGNPGPPQPVVAMLTLDAHRDDDIVDVASGHWRLEGPDPRNTPHPVLIPTDYVARFEHLEDFQAVERWRAWCEVDVTIRAPGVGSIPAPAAVAAGPFDFAWHPGERIALTATFTHRNGRAPTLAIS